MLSQTLNSENENLIFEVVFLFFTFTAVNAPFDIIFLHQAISSQHKRPKLEPHHLRGGGGGGGGGGESSHTIGYMGMYRREGNGFRTV